MLNKTTLIGRLGQDPEVTTFENGNTVAKFSLATSERFKNREGEQKEVTEWHNIVCWNSNLNKVIQSYLKKGLLVYVEGKIKSRSWEDQEGQKRYAKDIVIHQVQMLEYSKNDEDNKEQPAEQQNENAGGEEMMAF